MVASRVEGGSGSVVVDVELRVGNVIFYESVIARELDAICIKARACTSSQSELCNRRGPFQPRQNVPRYVDKITKYYKTT